MSFAAGAGCIASAGLGGLDGKNEIVGGPQANPRGNARQVSQALPHQRAAHRGTVQKTHRIKTCLKKKNGKVKKW